MHRTLVILTAFVSAGCLGSSPGLEPLAAGGRHVLFVGNSLTYMNDLPATLVAIAESAGDTIRVATEAAPNLALIDHLNGGTRALERIKQGGWHFVVLQQGPTPPGICRDSLILWTKMFDPHIRAGGARPAVFMSWPYQGPLSWFDEIEASFELAAKSVDGLVLPVAEAWRIAIRADSTIRLYAADGLHPTQVGTFLAALVIYERVTGHDARTLPLRAFANGRLLSLPDATIRLLQTAAHDAIVRQPVTSETARAVAVSRSSRC